MIDPFGKVTVLDGLGTTVRTASLYGNPWTFTGRRLDQETGLMYFRNRMYSVELGRFVGRDPWRDNGARPKALDGYADGFNLYWAAYVPRGMDAFGTWLGGTHKTLTELSLDAAERGKGIGTIKPNCRAWMLNKLKDSNVAQDDGAAFQDLRRHFNRSMTQSVAQGIAAYTGYLSEETGLFWASWNKIVTPCTTNIDKARCEFTLEVVGRLSHSWEDYYAHAVTLSGAKSPVWTVGITGSPDAPNPAQLKPSSYRSVLNPGEHEWFEPGGMEGLLREADAVNFVADKYRSLLWQWHNKCACCCPQ